MGDAALEIGWGANSRERVVDVEAVTRVAARARRSSSS